MAIQWSEKQLGVCTWYVSIGGYDTVAAWNVYLASVSLPQDCTIENIGNSTYPWRTWAAVVADTRVVSGSSVAVGVGKWDNAAYRSVVTKACVWVGATGTVIDMQLVTGSIFRVVARETIYDMSFVNSQFKNPTYTSVTAYNCYFSYLSLSTADSSYLYYCVVDYLIRGTGGNGMTLTNCTVLACATNTSICRVVSSIIRSGSLNAQYSTAYYSVVPNSVTGYANIIGVDPLFNNSAIGDYTLRSDSPCLYAGQHGSHIGALGEARSLGPNSAEFAVGTAVYSQTGALADIVKESYNVGGVTMYQFRLRDGVLSGTVESGWTDFGKVRAIDSLRYVSDMMYDAVGYITEAPSPSLDKLTVSYKAALTEAEKAGVAWQSADWQVVGLAINARYVKLLITLTKSV